MIQDNPIYRCEGYIVSVFSWLCLHFVGKKNKKQTQDFFFKLEATISHSLCHC